MTTLSTIKTAFQSAHSHLEEFISKEENMEKVNEFAKLTHEALKKGNKVFSCGNGGSMCDAMHYAEEFTGRFRNDRRPLPAMAISDPAYITCTANDFGYDEIFSRFVEGFGKEGDVLVCMSTSGNSPNAVKAVEKAKSIGMKTVGLLGKGGGKMKDLVDLGIIAPGETSDRIQEIHIKILHISIEAVEQLFSF